MKKMYRPAQNPSFVCGFAEIKSQTTRTAKQLTAKNLEDVATNKNIGDEARLMLKVFCLILNSFRRPDYQLDFKVFDQ